MKPKNNPRLALVFLSLSAIPAFTAAPLLAADVTSTWSAAAGGNWNLNANWTNVPVLGGFPNNGNGGVATYDAIISALGPAYTVTLNTNITVEDLMLSSTNATVSQTAGTFTATGAIALSAGIFQLNGGTISNTVINQSGSGILHITSSANLLSGVTVNGDLVLDVTSAQTKIGVGTTFTTAHMAANASSLGFAPGATLAGTILFDGAVSGTRHVEMDGTSGAFTIGATGVIRTDTGLTGDGNIGDGYNFGGAMTLTNSGLISSQVSGRTLTIAATSFTNTGIAEAINGGLLSIAAASTLANYTAGTQTLTGGTWIASSTGTASVLQLNRSSNILVNAADITLSGTSSVFRAGTTATTLEATLTTNSGALRILANRNYSNTSALSNSGLLQLGGGTFAAPGLTNAAAGELFGFGTVSVRPANSGLIRAAGGTLILGNGIQGGSGTVQIDAGSTLDLSGGASGSSANLLIHHGTTPGSLKLGSSDFTVQVDYTNAAFGSGNGFTPRANVGGGRADSRFGECGANVERQRDGRHGGDAGDDFWQCACGRCGDAKLQNQQQRDHGAELARRDPNDREWREPHRPAS